jgi:hypothetical protein
VRLTASLMLHSSVIARNRQMFELAAILVGIATCAAAQQMKASTKAVSSDLRSVEVPRLSKAPALADFEGMQPHGTAALEMAMVSDFIQSEPSDGKKATQKTEVYLGYDDKALYVVWLCFDNDPQKVRANLVRRENIYDDDVVAITIDAFRDHPHELNFANNPLGVQADGLWTEGSNNNPDLPGTRDSFTPTASLLDLFPVP